MVDEVLFNADIPRQHVREELVGEGGARRQLPDHVLLFDNDNRAP